MTNNFENLLKLILDEPKFKEYLNGFDVYFHIEKEIINIVPQDKNKGPRTH